MATPSRACPSKPVRATRRRCYCVSLQLSSAPPLPIWAPAWPCHYSGISPLLKRSLSSWQTGERPAGKMHQHCGDLMDSVTHNATQTHRLHHPPLGQWFKFLQNSLSLILWDYMYFLPYSGQLYLKWTWEKILKYNIICFAVQDTIWKNRKT